MLCVAYARPVTTTQSIAEVSESGVDKVLPQFEQSDADLMNFIVQNLVYPEQALKDKVEGRVIVQFVIGVDGNVHSPTILRGLTPECDAEVLRVVGLMPRWVPAQQDGVAVESNFVLPVSFVMQ
ncbi:MAG: energy transducer TonB [Bacteroidaceae bacterium]|nr:energy transducer TonB [Bacteroidaceae bacterium]